eukprot:NODE_4200_length_1101_cov_111.758691_g4002_i0.p1 GENE.NODE_4200_length_1101_cov_111.758691_g4002_i0~~NODE_4200_length_1101_cov_111.758691_g4002_i0.p1  ORF type:complete len:293 (+),score=29.40 NODE_4200_length_1101_cov_111.758691_g4002_i0:125-1003(+)
MATPPPSFGSMLTDLPSAFFCPIGMEVMADPVMCDDGHSYERTNIAKWLEVNCTSPLTGASLDTRSLKPNHALRSAIDECLTRLDIDRSGVAKATKEPVNNSTAAACYFGHRLSPRVVRPRFTRQTLLDHDGHPIDMTRAGGGSSRTTRRVGICSAHKRFICAEGIRLPGLAVAFLPKANRHALAAWEGFYLYLTGGPNNKDLESGITHVAFNSRRFGTFLSADPDGQVDLSRARVPDVWEKWQIMIHDNNQFSFRARNGKWLSAEPDGKLIANHSDASMWTRFTLWNMLTK